MVLDESTDGFYFLVLNSLAKGIWLTNHGTILNCHSSFPTLCGLVSELYFLSFKVVFHMALTIWHKKIKQ